MCKRTKLNVEYPLAKTLDEAIAFMENGGEVWQEISEDFPSCGGFDDVKNLMENFPHSDYEYNEDIQDYFLHLVPAKNEDCAEPFRVGETVWAIEKFFMTKDIYMYAGDSYKITEISPHGSTIKLDVPKDGNKGVKWPADKFCRCVLPVYKEKIYILSDTTSSGWKYTLNANNIYKDLEFLKEVCGKDILWSDEHEDFQKHLDKLGIGKKYYVNIRDIDGVDKSTGRLLYTVKISELITR